jgi:hypothetical protein
MPNVWAQGMGWGFSENAESPWFQQFASRFASPNSNYNLQMANDALQRPQMPWVLVFTGMRNQTIFDVVTLYWESDTPMPRNQAVPPPNAAYECVLYFCVKTFSSVARVNGTFTQNLVSTWPPANQTLPDEPDNSAEEDYPMMGKQGSTSQVNVTAKVEQTRNFTLTPPGSQKVYSIDRTTYDLLRW